MALSRLPPRGCYPSCLLHQLLIVLLLVQLEPMRPCNALDTDYCIIDVDIERNQIRIDSSLGVKELPAIFFGQRLHKFSILYIIHYIYLDLEPSEELQSVTIRVCDNTDNTDMECSADNSSNAAITNMASASANYLALGPITWDLVTLGFMDLTERTNVTTIALPLPPCAGRAEIINSNIFKLVRT